MKRKEKVAIIRDAAFLLFVVILMSVLLFGCTAQKPKVELKQGGVFVVCPLAQYSHNLLNEQMIARDFVWHQFGFKEASLIIDVYNASPPRTEIVPDTVGIYIKSGSSKGMIVLAKGGCLIDTRIVEPEFLRHLFKGVAI